MMESNSSKVIPYISLATLLLSLLGFIFGDNILEKFSGPELILNSTKVKMNLPDKLLSIYTNDQNDGYMPEYYRVIEITNEGSAPSKNLRLTINTDGGIYDYKIDSPEKINELKVSEGKITTELQRLSPNAKILLELWLNDSDKIFQVNYADDNNSGFLKKEQEKNNNKIFDYIMIIISIFSTGALVYSKYYLISSRKLEEVNLENQELENQVDIIIERFKEETNNNNEEEVPKEEKELFKRLEEFIKNSPKL